MITKPNSKISGCRSYVLQTTFLARNQETKLVNDQFSKASAISRNDLLRTRGKEAKKLFPFVLTFNPNLPNVGNIIRKNK